MKIKWCESDVREVRKSCSMLGVKCALNGKSILSN